MKFGNIYIICFLFTSCISSNKLGSKNKNLYFKNFDLITLTSQDTMKGPKKLPFVKEVWNQGRLQRIEFYHESKRLPVKIMLPLKQYSTRAYSSRTFNGKQITDDTLINSGNQLFEFRFKRVIGFKRPFYEIFHYVKLAEDSFSLSTIEVTDPSFKFHPASVLSDSEITNFKRHNSSFGTRYWFSNWTLHFEMQVGQQLEIRRKRQLPPGSKFFWRLLDHSNWRNNPIRE